jgi:hypothetical protein
MITMRSTTSVRMLALYHTRRLGLPLLRSLSRAGGSAAGNNLTNAGEPMQKRRLLCQPMRLPLCLNVRLRLLVDLYPSLARGQHPRKTLSSQPPQRLRHMTPTRMQSLETSLRMIMALDFRLRIDGAKRGQRFGEGSCRCAA